MKTYDEINQRIKEGKAVVVTAEEVLQVVAEKGVKQAAREIDVVTTATFAPMCSSGAFLNFGHSDPPIRMTSILLNNVPAYGGLAAVDTYIGATEGSTDVQKPEYGGAHIIEDLVKGKEINLKARSPGTDCYPLQELDTRFTLQSLKQAYLHNPRNAYQNYGAAANTGAETLHTYMGTLLPDVANITYCSAGELSPLLNDPYYRTIGVGTRIFLGGAEGYVTWEGTQHNPTRPRGGNGVPMLPAGTLTVTGDLKNMSSRFLRAAYYTGYGSTLFVGIGVPIPILDEEMMEYVSVANKDIFTEVFDYAVARREKPSLGRVSYEELRSGWANVAGRKVRTAPLSSLAKAREIATLLKSWIHEQQFQLTQPVRTLSQSDKGRQGGHRQRGRFFLSPEVMLPGIGQKEPSPLSPLSEKRVLLTFPADCADQPLVGQLVRRFNVDINILRASISHKAEGKMLLAITGDNAATEAGLAFLQEKGLGVRSACEQIAVDSEKCVHCGTCTGICMIGALSMAPPDWRLKYDGALCVGCLACIEACPLKAISPLHEGEF